MDFQIGKEIDFSCPILLVGYGNFIDLIPIDSIENSNSHLKSNLLIKAHFISDYEIIYSCWIATNLIFFLDSKKSAHILYSGNFEEGSYIEKNPRNMNQNNKAILNLQKIDSELAFQTFIKDKNDRLRPFFQNTVVVSNLEKIFMIGYRQILVGKLYKW